MTRTFINGFLHRSEDDAVYFEDEVKIITEGDREGFGDSLEYIGYMEFTDGSYANFYAHTVLSSGYYMVEYPDEDTWFNSRVWLKSKYHKP